ncbi:MAG: hypothetical protein OXF83_10960, partial [Anaerolineaceae bacterium]|nr:hypothetical protein [Anaerolineaceae bacterium]
SYRAEVDAQDNWLYTALLLVFGRVSPSHPEHVYVFLRLLGCFDTSFEENILQQMRQIQP